MTTVKLDIVDGSSGRLTHDGLELYRIALVHGLTGSASERIYKALTAWGMPELNDAHPTVDNLYLAEMTPNSKKPAVVQVRLVYRERDEADTSPASMQVGASLTQSETNVDRLGNKLLVTYKGVDQNVIVPILQPRETKVFQRTESTSPGAQPRLFVGKVNSELWDMDAFGGVREWMCMSITSSSDDNWATWTTTYTFESNPDTWDEEVMYIDSASGLPPADLVADVGIKTYRIYDEVDFNILNLTTEDEVG